MAIANLPPEAVSSKLHDEVIKLLALSNVLDKTSAALEPEDKMVDTLAGFALILEDTAYRLDDLATALTSKVDKVA